MIERRQLDNLVEHRTHRNERQEMGLIRSRSALLNRVTHLRAVIVAQ